MWIQMIVTNKNILVRKRWKKWRLNKRPKKKLKMEANKNNTKKKCKCSGLYKKNLM